MYVKCKTYVYSIGTSASPRCSTRYKSELPSPYFITYKIIHRQDANPKQYKNEFTDIMKLLWAQFLYRDLVNITEHGEFMTFITKNVLQSDILNINRGLKINKFCFKQIAPFAKYFLNKYI